MSGARSSIAKSRAKSRSPRRLAAGALALGALTVLLPAAAHSARLQNTRLQGTMLAIRQAAASRPHVYLMRGLLNIFSLGMDQLATQIAGHGIEASVYNHTLADSVVAGIVQKYRAGDHGPYILVGHSLGADAVMTMTQQLDAAGVPVALVVPFDGTGSYFAPRNVACVLNLTQRKYAYMRPGSGFHGRLQNVDVSSDPNIDHFTIDKSPRLQAIALGNILQAAHSESCRPGATGPVEARPKMAPIPKIASPEPAPKPLPVPARSASPVIRSGFEG